MSGSAYTVSARLNVTGNYATVFRQLGRSLTALDRQIKGTEANLVRLMGRFPTLASVATRSATVAGAQMGALRSQVMGVTTAVSGSSRALTNQANRLDRLTRSARASMVAANNLAASMQALSSIAPPPRIPPPGRSGGGSGPGRRRNFSDQVDSWVGRSAIAGVAANQVGRGFGAIINAGGKEQEMLTVMRAQGIPEEDIASMREAAIGMIRQVPGSSITDAIGAIRETRMALGPSASVDEVNRAAPEILRTARLSASLANRPTAEALRPFARTSAVTGGFTDDVTGERNIERGLEQLRVLQDATTAFSTGPRQGIDPREWEMLARRGGIPLRRMSHEGLAAMATLVQEKGGEKSGTELTAFSRFVMTQVAPKKNLALAADMGLRAMTPQAARQANVDQAALIKRMVADKRITESEAEKIGRYNIQPGQFRGRGFAGVRPDIYTSEVMIPTLKSRGFNTEEEQLDKAEEIFPKETSRRFIGAFLQVREVIEDIAAFRMAREMRERGNNPTSIILEQGYANSLANMQAGFTNLLTALGNAPSVIGLLNDTARGLNDLADVVRSNPSIMEDFIQNLRIFVTDVRTLAEALASLVTTLGPIIRSLPFEGVRNLNRMQRGEIGLDQFVYEGMDEQGQRGMDAVGRGWNATKDYIRGMRDRILGRSPPAPDAGPRTAPAEGPEAIPPSRGPPGGIQLNSFEPMAPGSRETVVHTVVNLDGRLLTDVVTRHQERTSGAPVQGSNRYELRRGGVTGAVRA